MYVSTVHRIDVIGGASKINTKSWNVGSIARALRVCALIIVCLDRGGARRCTTAPDQVGGGQ